MTKLSSLTNSQLNAQITVGASRLVPRLYVNEQGLVITATEVELATNPPIYKPAPISVFYSVRDQAVRLILEDEPRSPALLASDFALKSTFNARIEPLLVELYGNAVLLQLPRTLQSGSWVLEYSGDILQQFSQPVQTADVGINQVGALVSGRLLSIEFDQDIPLDAEITSFSFEGIDMAGEPEILGSKIVIRLASQPEGGEEIGFTFIGSGQVNSFFCYATNFNSRPQAVSFQPQLEGRPLLVSHEITEAGILLTFAQPLSPLSAVSFQRVKNNFAIDGVPVNEIVLDGLTVLCKTEEPFNKKRDAVLQYTPDDEGITDLESGLQALLFSVELLFEPVLISAVANCKQVILKYNRDDLEGDFSNAIQVSVNGKLSRVLSVTLVRETIVVLLSVEECFQAVTCVDAVTVTLDQKLATLPLSSSRGLQAASLAEVIAKNTTQNEPTITRADIRLNQLVIGWSNTISSLRLPKIDCFSLVSSGPQLSLLSMTQSSNEISFETNRPVSAAEQINLTYKPLGKTASVWLDSCEIQAFEQTVRVANLTPKSSAIVEEQKGCGLFGFPNQTLVTLSPLGQTTLEPASPACRPQIDRQGCGILGEPPTTYVVLFKDCTVTRYACDSRCGVPEQAPLQTCFPEAKRAVAPLPVPSVSFVVQPPPAPPAPPAPLPPPAPPAPLPPPAPPAPQAPCPPTAPRLPVNPGGCANPLQPATQSSIAQQQDQTSGASGGGTGFGGTAIPTPIDLTGTYFSCTGCDTSGAGKCSNCASGAKQGLRYKNCSNCGYCAANTPEPKICLQCIQCERDFETFTQIGFATAG